MALALQWEAKWPPRFVKGRNSMENADFQPPSLNSAWKQHRDSTVRGTCPHHFYITPAAWTPRQSPGGLEHGKPTCAPAGDLSPSPPPRSSSEGKQSDEIQNFQGEEKLEKGSNLEKFTSRAKQRNNKDSVREKTSNFINLKETAFGAINCCAACCNQTIFTYVDHICKLCSTNLTEWKQICWIFMLLEALKVLFSQSVFLNK